MQAGYGGSQEAAWQAELDRTGEVIVGGSRRQYVRLLLIALALTAVSLLCTLRPQVFDDAPPVIVAVVGIVGIAFFGVLGIPAAILGLVRGGKRVVVTRAGVRVTRGFDAHWTEVAAVGVVVISRTPLVVLRMHDERAQDAARQRAGRRGTLAAVLSGLGNSITRGPDLALPSPLDADPTHLAAWLNGFAAGRVAR